MDILTAENYFEDTHFMSVSSYKLFKKCEKLGLQGFKSEPSKDMLIGSYVDAYVEGTLDKFKEEHPDLISTRGASKGGLKAEFVLADKICEYIDADPVFKQFMSGDKQTIMTGEIAGIPFKGKLDSYSPHIAINDLKVMRTVTDRYGNYYDFITQWGYDIQMAVYQELVRQNTGEQLPCYICAVTKENPINSVIVKIPQNILNIALYGVESNVERFYKVKKGIDTPVGCGICSACITERKATPIISLDEIIGGEY